jgi:uncharacterized protein (DUF2336 family)
LLLLSTTALRIAGRTLRRITDLFLNDADRLSDEQIKVFDDVLCLLTSEIESIALAELSGRLARVDKAPSIIKRLAQDEEINVAGPVLAGSTRLTTTDLTEVALAKGQPQLLASSERHRLEAPVTGVL